MNEPTEEQIKRFWKHFGWQIEADIDGFKLPEIDLNNIFKYAVPFLKESCEEWWDVIVEWAKDITGNYEKDTIALFNAIYKVI